MSTNQNRAITALPDTFYTRDGRADYQKYIKGVGLKVRRVSRMDKLRNVLKQIYS